MTDVDAVTVVVVVDASSRRPVVPVEPCRPSVTAGRSTRSRVVVVVARRGEPVDASPWRGVGRSSGRRRAGRGRGPASAVSCSADGAPGRGRGRRRGVPTVGVPGARLARETRSSSPSHESCASRAPCLPGDCRASCVEPAAAERFFEAPSLRSPSASRSVFDRECGTATLTCARQEPEFGRARIRGPTACPTPGEREVGAGRRQFLAGKSGRTVARERAAVASLTSRGRLPSITWTRFQSMRRPT